MSNDGAWTPYGLADGCQLGVTRYDYIGGDYTISATGPLAAILDIARVWGRMTRARTDVLDILDALRVGS